MGRQRAGPWLQPGPTVGSYDGGYALAAALEPVASSIAVSGVATFSSDWLSALTPSISSITAAKIMSPALRRYAINRFVTLPVPMSWQE